MNMSSYDEFIEYIKEHILDWIPQGEDLSVQIGTMKKNNGIHEDYLAILNDTMEGEHTVAPILYMKNAYENYLTGVPLESILNDLSNTYLQSANPRFDFTKLQDYESVKNSIILALVNTDTNRELLQSLPHQNMDGLSVIYKIDVIHSPMWHEKDCGFNAVVNINYELMEAFGIDQDTLHQVALENTERLYPPVLQGLNARTNEMLGASIYDTDEEEMYVLTNEQGYLGATAILYPEKMEEIIETLGDVYIIPSSIHEVMLVPKMSGNDVKELRQMLCDVNQEGVSPQEYLGDKIYEYNAHQKKLEVAAGQIPVKRKSYHL